MKRVFMFCAMINWWIVCIFVVYCHVAPEDAAMWQIDYMISFALGSLLAFAIPLLIHFLWWLAGELTRGKE